ncbi:hypothetical protein G7054_g10467 [Neopestalotiopsis clavispora]|nr:hypothetical protein G7054_g10467 [Neopestalotiopsis clavispora]
MASKNSSENTLDGDLITNVLNYFDASGDLCGDITCKVDCSICTTELAILQPADEEHKTWTVLETCGHMFCHECIDSWIAASHDPKCPQCRADLRHSRCRHKYRPQEIVLTNGFNIHNDVPKVVSQLPEDCQDCRRGSASSRRENRERVETVTRQDRERVVNPFDFEDTDSSSEEEDYHGFTNSGAQEYGPSYFRHPALADMNDHRPESHERPDYLQYQEYLARQSSGPLGSTRREREGRRRRDGPQRSRSHGPRRPMAPRPMPSYPIPPPPPGYVYVRPAPGPVRFAPRLRLDSVECSYTEHPQDE